MTERDVFFLVMVLITLGTLTAFIVQFARRRGGRSRGWWEGPWDDDERKR